MSPSQSRPRRASLPANAADAAPAEPAQRLHAERRARRPTRARCRAARTRGRRSGRTRRATDCHAAPSPGAWRSNSARVRVGGAKQERRLAVRIGRAGREVGVQVLEPAGGEVVAEQGVRRAADPERMPGGEHVVPEARLGDLGGLDRAAEPVVPLEHADAPAGTGEQRAAGERVDAAPDQHRVVLSHLAAPASGRTLDDRRGVRRRPLPWHRGPRAARTRRSPDEPAYRAAQVWEWAARGAASYGEMTNVPAALRALARAAACPSRRSPCSPRRWRATAP